MAHFAQLDENNKVLQVIVIDNEVIKDGEGESEEKGIEFCQKLLGDSTVWKQTSYNANFRKNYACIGGTYNEELNAFINIQPFESWILNRDTCKWEAPVPYPSDDKAYDWNEDTKSWDLIT